MDGLYILPLVLLGLVSLTQGWISASVSVVMVSPGDSITLYCDYKLSNRVYRIAWFRNCSHENQPSLLIQGNLDPTKYFRYRLNLVKNTSSESYDLVITNITDTDEGLYYCGAQQNEVVDRCSTPKYIYKYGNTTTRIMFRNHSSVSDPDPGEPRQCCGMCWTLLFSLCPALALLSSLLSSLLVYHLCKEKAKEHQVDEKISGHTRKNLDEDVCYAALEIHQPPQRPKKRIQSPDFCTYSAINTCRM